MRGRIGGVREVKRQFIIGIVVAAVILGILLKRSVRSPLYHHKSSDPAPVETNSGPNSSAAASVPQPDGVPSAGSLDVSVGRTVPGMPLPTGLQASIDANFPGYRIPGRKDIIGGWAIEKKPTDLSFLCRGDFNGDGIEDVAIILVGEQNWRLVIFEKDGQERHQVVFVARPKSKAELGKNWEQQMLSDPQQLLLRTVRKGETWAPEAGDDPKLGPMKVDAIEMIAKPTPNAYFSSLIIFKEGKYQQVYLDPLVELPAGAL
jgi:hypothetical protein